MGVWTKVLERLGLAPAKPIPFRKKLQRLNKTQPRGRVSLLVRAIEMRRLRAATAALVGITGWSTADVLAFIEALPLPLLINVSAETAQMAKAKLESVGVTVTISQDTALLQDEAHTGTPPAPDKPTTGKLMLQAGDYTVRLRDVGRSERLVMQVMQSYLGYSKEDAKLIVRSSQRSVLVGVDRHTAVRAQEKLQAVGATVTVDSLKQPASSRAAKTEQQETTPPPPATYQTGFYLRLVAPGPDAEQVVHLLHEITGLSLKETRVLVGKAPVNVLESLNPHVARAVQKRLAELGAQAELVGLSKPEATKAAAAPTLVMMPGDYEVTLQRAGEQLFKVAQLLYRWQVAPTVADIRLIVQRTPAKIFTNIALQSAERVKDELEALGAMVKIEAQEPELAETAVLSHPDNSSFLFGDYALFLLEPGPDPEQIVRILHEILSNRSLAEVETLVTSAPQLLVQQVVLETAETIKRRLETAGALATIKYLPPTE